MSRVFAFPMAPANYTLDIIKNVYEPKGIKYAFVHGSSEASDEGCRDALVIEQINGWNRRLLAIWRIMKENDIFIVNSYTEKISLTIIMINILFFNKPMGLSSDTQLRVPVGGMRRFVKWLFLGFLFRRKCIYGLPGGTKEHVRLFSYYGMEASRIMVLPMMVDNTKYHRDKVDLPGDKFRFVYVGRLAICKNVSSLIKAFGLICTKNINVELHIIGDGPEKSSLVSLAEGLPVVFHGRLYGFSLVETLHTMHCLVLYSSYEPWGLVVNEALASGIPCIVSNQVGARFDLVAQEPQTGFVVNVNDIGALADVMRTIASDKVKWQQYVSNAILRMKDWDYGRYKKNLDNFITCVGGQEAC